MDGDLFFSLSFFIAAITGMIEARYDAINGRRASLPRVNAGFNAEIMRDVNASRWDFRA